MNGRRERISPEISNTKKHEILEPLAVLLPHNNKSLPANRVNTEERRTERSRKGDILLMIQVLSTTLPKLHMSFFDYVS